MTPDRTDQRILSLLEEDGRRTLADIGDRVGLSPAPVKRRIDRLEAAGIIRGYTALVDHDAAGRSLDAFVELRFGGSTDVDDVLAAIRDIEQVVEVATIAGDPDAMVRVRVAGMEELQGVIVRMRRSGHLSGTKTLMVLDSWRRSG